MCATYFSGTLNEHSSSDLVLFFLLRHSLQMFITNEFAKSNPAIQLAMANYQKQLQREQHYQQQVRDGIIPAPNWNDTQSWDISDRD